MEALLQTEEDGVGAIFKFLPWRHGKKLLPLWASCTLWGSGSPWRQSYVHCTHGHPPPVSLKTQILNKTNALIWLQWTVLYQIIPSPAVAWRWKALAVSWANVFRSCSVVDRFFFSSSSFIGRCFIYQSVCQFILICHGLSFSFGPFGMMRVYENVWVLISLVCS